MSDDSDMPLNRLVDTALEDSPRGTKSRLARELGVTRQTVSAWTEGTLPIHPKWFIQLAEALDLDYRNVITAGGQGNLIEGMTTRQILDLWERLHPGSVPEAVQHELPIEMDASGVDLDELRREDPATYDEVVRIAREALARVNKRRR